MISPAAPSFAQLRGNMASTRETSPRSSQKVVVIMPAYNAAKTLRMTYTALPHDRVDLVLLVDDGSSDATVEIARQLNLELFIHNRNYGYGGNQKTCYTEALKANADIVVMVHPDYQYDPTCLPQVIEPIERGEADVVLGSRLMSVSPVAQGMPWWKYIGNRLLTKVENAAFGLHLSEYHTGYRAFSREVLETINFQMNADGFIFDQEVIAQIVDARFRLGILWLVFRYGLHRSHLLRQNKFQSLKRRYSKVERSSTGSEDG